MQTAPTAPETGIVEAALAIAETLAKATRKVGRFAVMLLGFALVAAAVVGLRFGIYEYGHGDAQFMRHLLGTLVAGSDQTSR
jgi:hypothetical protein